MYFAVLSATSRPKYSSTTCSARSIPELGVRNHLHPAADSQRRLGVRHGVKPERHPVSDHDVLEHLPGSREVDHRGALGDDERHRDGSCRWGGDLARLLAERCLRGDRGGGQQLQLHVPSATLWPVRYVAMDTPYDCFQMRRSCRASSKPQPSAIASTVRCGSASRSRATCTFTLAANCLGVVPVALRKTRVRWRGLKAAMRASCARAGFFSGCATSQSCTRCTPGCRCVRWSRYTLRCS